MAKRMPHTGEGTKLRVLFFSFSFLCDGSVSRGGENSEGLMAAFFSSGILLAENEIFF